MPTRHALLSALLAAAIPSLACVPTHACAAATTAIATAQSQPIPSAQPITAVVSIPPLKGLIEPMLPPGSTLDVLIPPGVSEHGYEIPPRRLANLNRADLVVLVGMGLEPSVEKFLRERATPAVTASRTVITFAQAADIQSLPADQVPQSGCGPSCTHHHDGDHEHHAADPHLWLDPVLSKALVNRIADLLVEREALRTGQPITSDHPILQARDSLLARLSDLDADFRALADSASNKTIVVGHDAYGWLAKRYGFETIAIAGLNANEPTPRAINNAIDAVKSKGVKFVFVEPQLNQSAGRRIARAAGAQIRVLDPLGDGDYFKVMNQNLAALREAMAPADSAGAAARTTR
ncbi:MAG: zinc ABC transporter substrate-binding protein [Phycisphaeraceae bacterium]|nr:zinc ABC transporter substrate-binding protein [Phycisphaeraceae bacterium]